MYGPGPDRLSSHAVEGSPDAVGEGAGGSAVTVQSADVKERELVGGPPPERAGRCYSTGLVSASTGGPVLEETTVGSYFVATYPPFSVWTREAVESDARQALAAAPVAGVPLGL